MIDAATVVRRVTHWSGVEGFISRAIEKRLAVLRIAWRFHAANITRQYEFKVPPIMLKQELNHHKTSSMRMKKCSRTATYNLPTCTATSDLARYERDTRPPATYVY